MNIRQISAGSEIPLLLAWGGVRTAQRRRLQRPHHCQHDPGRLIKCISSIFQSAAHPWSDPISISSPHVHPKTCAHAPSPPFTQYLVHPLTCTHAPSPPFSTSLTPSWIVVARVSSGRRPGRRPSSSSTTSTCQRSRPTVPSLPSSCSGNLWTTVAGKGAGLSRMGPARREGQAHVVTCWGATGVPYRCSILSPFPPLLSYF